MNLQSGSKLWIALCEGVALLSYLTTQFFSADNSIYTCEIELSIKRKVYTKRGAILIKNERNHLDPLRTRIRYSNDKSLIYNIVSYFH